MVRGRGGRGERTQFRDSSSANTRYWLAMSESIPDYSLFDASLIEEALGPILNARVEGAQSQMVRLYASIKDNCPVGGKPKYKALVQPVAQIALQIGVRFPMDCCHSSFMRGGMTVLRANAWPARSWALSQR